MHIYIYIYIYMYIYYVNIYIYIYIHIYIYIYIYIYISPGWEPTTLTTAHGGTFCPAARTTAEPPGNVPPPMQGETTQPDDLAVRK